MNFNLTVCISREFGSGGHEIGQKLAEKLGLELIDRKIVEKAAQMGKIDVSYFKDDGDSSGGNFLFNQMGGHPSSLSDSSRVITSQKLFYLQSAAIKKLAEKGGVFVGRCADIVLDGRANLYKIFIHSPLNNRIKRIKAIYNLNDKEALNLIKKTDKQRSSYYNLYTKTKWGHPSNYDMILNSSHIGIDKCVDLISLYINMEE